MRTEAETLEELDHRCALVLAHQAVVHVKELEPLRSEGTREKRGRDGRVDTTRGQQEHRAVADLHPDPFHLVAYERLHGPGGLAATDLEHEVREHLVAVDRVVDLGMELESVAAQGVGADRGVPVIRSAIGGDAPAELPEPRPQVHHAVVMAHPHLLHRPESLEQRVLPGEMEPRAAPLPATVHDLASIVLGDFLVTEAEAEDRQFEVVDAPVVVRVLSV